jgi:hypothetical protein
VFRAQARPALLVGLTLAVHPAEAPPASAQLCTGDTCATRFTQLRNDIATYVPTSLQSGLVERTFRAEGFVPLNACVSINLLRSIDNEISALGVARQVTVQGVAALHSDIVNIAQLIAPTAPCLPPNPI